MTCCTRNPFVPDYENVIWLCSGDQVPAGWRELSRWSFQSRDAVVVWPVGVDLPPSAPPLGPFYGVGAGKIAIHINPDQAIVSGGAVIGVPNLGGAGAMFDAVASAGVAKAADYLSLSDSNDLKLANPADIQGVRLFLPSYRTVTQQAYFMGALGGINTNVRYAHTGTAETTILFNASNGGISPSAGAIPRGIGVWQLVEIEVSDDSTRIWCNGIEVTAGGGRSTPYPIQQIGRHPDMVTGPVWSGRIGDIVGVTLGGGAASAISAARQYISEKYGIVVS